MIETIAAIRLQSGLAPGAAASHSFNAPHSSASTWENAIQRKFFRREHVPDRLLSGRKEPARIGVKQEGLLVDQ